MPAAAIIVPLAVSAASTAATSLAIGTTLAATLGSIGGAIVTGAIGGAIGGAITGGIEGGDIGMDVLTGAVQGGVGAGVSAAVPSSGITNEIATDFPGISAKTATSIGEGISKGVGTLAGGTAAGLVGGQKFGQALKSGAVSGIASGVASGVGNQIFGGDQTPTNATLGPQQPSLEPNQFGTMGTLQNVPPGMDPIRFSPQFGYSPVEINAGGSFFNDQINQGAQGSLSRGISTGLNDLLSTGQSAGGAINTGPSERQPQGSLNLPQAPTGISTANPSVSALAQALRTVPDLGYSPGGPVFGSQSTAKPKKVWNRASLRVMDEETP